MTAPIYIFTQGPRTWASSRFRGYWLQDTAPELFEVYDPDTLPDFDGRKLVVFQKRFSADDIGLAKEIQSRGIKVAFDLTDPLWWWEPERVTAMMALADVVTVSSEGLLERVKQKPIPGPDKVRMIADRMKPDYHPTTAEHGEREKPVLVWYGASANRKSLNAAAEPLMYLAKMGLEFTLRIIDEQPQQKITGGALHDIEYVPWSLETFHANLIDSDVALLPPHPGLWGALKSPNKQITAMWAGLPVSTGFFPEEIAALLTDPQERARIGRENRKLAEAEHDIAQSVDEWRALLDELEGGA